MTANLLLPLDRVETLARAIEDSPEVTSFATASQEAQRVESIAYAAQLSVGELAALVGEILATRKMASIGSGLYVTMRGTSKAERKKAFYRRLNFRFALEIGSPTGTVDPSELDQTAAQALGMWGKKLLAEIDELKAEIAAARAKEDGN